jgi:hypothetical protein
MHEAVRRADEAALIALLRSGADPNIVRPHSVFCSLSRSLFLFVCSY